MATTMTLIAKQTIGPAGASSVTFSNIPQTYTDLKVVASVRATTSNWIQAINLTFNSSRTTNQVRLYAIGSSAASDTSVGSGQGEFGWAVGNTATANTFSNNEIYIPNYRSTTAKSYLNDSTVENNSASNNLIAMLASLNTSVTIAINSITIEPSADSFAELSTFYLYGISNSSTQNNSVPYAYGGDIIKTDGTYWYHTFLYSGTFTPLKALTCDYLVVAGGGGGGTGSNGGGGGAGGLRSTVTATGGGGSLESPISLTANTVYAATVGAGGIANTSGNDSVFATITSIGGGYGAANYDTQAATGGSGGGATYGSVKNGAGTTNQGYAGGTAATAMSGVYGAGGGGGAGQVGQNGTPSVGGNGGNGVAVSISGSSVTYAGGGGGSTDYGTPGSGGSGGGGTGTSGGTVGTSGTANTGGGSGADRNASGLKGGSGIIIVRYAV